MQVCLRQSVLSRCGISWQATAGNLQHCSSPYALVFLAGDWDIFPPSLLQLPRPRRYLEGFQPFSQPYQNRLSLGQILYRRGFHSPRSFRTVGEYSIFERDSSMQCSDQYPGLCWTFLLWTGSVKSARNQNLFVCANFEPPPGEV